MSQQLARGVSPHVCHNHRWRTPGLLRRRGIENIWLSPPLFYDVVGSCAAPSQGTKPGAQSAVRASIRSRQLDMLAGIGGL